MSIARYRDNFHSIELQTCAAATLWSFNYYWQYLSTITGPQLSFTIRLEPRPWPERSDREARIGFGLANIEEQEWRRKQVEHDSTVPLRTVISRHLAASCLKIHLSRPSTFREDIIFDIRVKITHEAETTANPIIFHMQLFNNSGSYQLARPRNGAWESYDDDSGGCGSRIVDDPDIYVQVGLSERFARLRPGES